MVFILFAVFIVYCSIVYRSLVALSLSLIIPTAAADIDPGKLWLPKVYKHHLDSMKQAADLAVAEPDCVTFIKGSVLQERTTHDTAFFSFLCRGPEQQTFAILVDDQTFTVTNPLKEIREAKERALVEKQRQDDEAEQERKQQEQLHYWPLCFDEINKKLTFMKDLAITSRIPPIPVINMQETFTYSMNFNATSTTGKLLKYRASCMISSLEQMKVKIKPRRS